MSVAVLGSGGGALGVAADLSRGGHDPVLADLPDFAANLEPVAERGGVVVRSGWNGDEVLAVDVAPDVGSAVAGSALVVVVVPCFGHEPFMEALAPVLEDGQTLLFVGEGSGAVVARRVMARHGSSAVKVGETNTLPYFARPAGPGAVSLDRKAGGVLLAGLPAADTVDVVSQIHDVWPCIEAAESVWETVLLNFNAIDHVATMLANAGTLENRTGGMLLWGEGATPSVVRVIEAVDLELLALREALGLSDRRRYRDFLIAQGFARDAGDLYTVLRGSKLASASAPTGPQALDSRFLTEDVPYALVLASAIGREVGADVPVIDGLIAISSAMLGRDFRSEGRDLRSLGLAGAGAQGLIRFAATGKFPD